MPNLLPGTAEVSVHLAAFQPGCLQSNTAELQIWVRRGDTNCSCQSESKNASALGGLQISLKYVDKCFRIWKRRDALNWNHPDTREAAWLTHVHAGSCVCILVPSNNSVLQNILRTCIYQSAISWLGLT